MLCGKKGGPAKGVDQTGKRGKRVKGETRNKGRGADNANRKRWKEGKLVG